MDEVEVEVLEAKVGQGLLASTLNVLGGVEGVPQLADHKQVCSLTQFYSVNFSQLRISLEK